ncbi:Uncharacterized conserved protein, DUF305 family [Daejeonella rubra]|uniref:Uncharacterized conserved protein, DUF305 family n=1 Tax=Daejeonella rubra TaxID=990371 RepID=A0A1G9NMB7_9SPHI|nr:DUF305 domain-containing protein [Daejeonella rubra]SDL87530.1 Uncharacterized conserved protein, DUF305 family [Daejeonella rubra]
MKNTIKIIAVVGLILFTQACSKDDDNKIKVQDHDQNQMMSIMHSMMTKMMAMPMSKDPDDDFAMMMKMHHQGAIDMSSAELKNGDDPKMKEIAQKIIDAQKAEIVQLETFLAVHNPHMMSMEFTDQMMKEMEKSGRQADLQVINGDIDHDFAMLMIGHHHAAIENSRLELIYGHDASMKTMAQKIIDAQQAEIKELQEWLLSDGK